MAKKVRAGSGRRGNKPVPPRRAPSTQPAGAAGSESRAKPAPPADVGVAALNNVELQRRALRMEVRREINARIDGYFRGMGSPDRGRRAAAGRRGPGGPPGGLRIIAEGDSWFDYPWFLLREGGVIPRLASRLRDNLVGRDILNLAHHGDEVRQMLGVSQRADLIRCLQKAQFDAILFSGGGNDIVGDQFTLWLDPTPPRTTPESALRSEILQSVLNVVIRGYQDLVDIRDQFAPGAVVFVHAYSIPFPQNKGVCGTGPWLFPALQARGWTDPEDQRKIVRIMLNAFGQRLRQWADSHDKVQYVDTLNLDIPREDWDNEIHPDSDGFNMVADLFAESIRRQFGL